MSSHWNRYSAYWNRLGPPLRPTASTIAAYREALAPCDARVLLYGVTPELAGLGRTLVAVDGSIGMIEQVWPGDGPDRRAILANWLSLPFADASLTAAFGDATPNNIPFPDATEAMLCELERVVAPGGRAVFRAFCSPETQETMSEVRRATLAGEVGSFHALKWRVAMARTAEDGSANIRVADILGSFDELFPDRPALAQATGWSMDAITTIDAYKGSAQVYSFPKLSELVALLGAHFGEVHVVPSGDYPLAERCPILVCTIP